jgi:hypothetical protein
LPGQIIIGANVPAGEESKNGGRIGPDDIAVRALFDPITDAEFQAAKASMNEWLQRPVELFWLDLDTYRINDVAADRRMVEALKLADVTAYAEKLRKAPRAVVLVQSKPNAN